MQVPVCTYAGSRCVSRCGSGPRWACSDWGLGEGGPKSLCSIAGYSVVSVSLERPRPVPVSPPHSVDPQHTFVVTHDTRESLSATAAPALASGVSPGRSAASQLPPVDVLEPEHSRSVTHTALSPPGCSSTAPACCEDRVWSAASAPPGFFLYPVTPLFQLGRTGRDRRPGPRSAVAVSHGRHFVFRDGSGAARERGAFMKVLIAGDSQGSRGRKDH
ncbi:hypothetical protein NDU88_004087 [Pleurodeles waltl]|uniref:Uncharacterized protein n=1 Tax=Pleurodeles waltl TaxID=8319 RepID=A0AAV7M5Z2_PLEWA|nr:hypothetical protein NDU88_004087 [Pleurodeles waltl]